MTTRSSGPSPIFDSQIFSLQRHGGISRYFSALIGGLSEIGVPVHADFRFTINDHLSPALARGRVHLPEFPHARGACRLLNRATRARRPHGNLLHTTYYEAPFLHDHPDLPMVATIHDMTPELFPELFATNPHAEKRAYVERATRVICISQSTKRDLVRLYATDARKIDVVHHGIDLAGVDDLEDLPSLPAEYILFVGARNGYKNFTILLQAMAELQRSGRAPALICVGGGAWTDDERGWIAANSGATVLLLKANDRQLRHAMRHAIALVYPSLYEGFGLPIVEAMLQRCPLVLANASCFPEIAQDAAIYFDPSSPGDLAEALGRVWSDKALAGRMRARGQDLLALYGSEIMTQKTLEVYRFCL